MLAAFAPFTPARMRCVLLAALCFAALPAVAQPTLDQRLADLRETARYVPDKGLEGLHQLEGEIATAPPMAKAEYLTLTCMARLGLGQRKEAMAAAEAIVRLGNDSKDKAITAKGLLAKAYATFAQNELKASHQLVWEAEKLAEGTANIPLRVQAAISSGQSYAEDGNFPLALAKLQNAVALARQSDEPVYSVMSLYALANLYDSMKEYDKGFALVTEAMPIAEKAGLVARQATLKNMEFFLASDTNQPQRALKALLEGLALERKIGANKMIATSLVNLSDAYLRAGNMPKVLDFAQQAIAAARRINDDSVEATANVNIGQALIATGKLAEGKRSFESGLDYYEKQGDKPNLQSVLMEYGSSLEKAGDAAGAIKAYHRERALSNELFEKQRQKAMWELQEKYETEKKQKQIELLSRENQVKNTELDNRKLQTRVWWLLAIVMALVVTIVGMLYRKVRQANAQLEVKNLELKQQSSRDPLTSLYNRRHFQEYMRNHLQSEKRGAGATGEEMVGALFLLDVDHFKHVNDSYGHAAGDAVLKMISENLRVILRETDMIVRWGGEEFLAFLPAIPRSGLDEIARRLLTGISAHTIDFQDTKISVNVSIGFAPFPLAPGSQPLPWERAVNLVDMALYLAKAHGRNRAYGVRGFSNFDQTSLESVEQDLERAWRAGFVDLSVVLGGWPEPKPGAATPVPSAA